MSARVWIAAAAAVAGVVLWLALRAADGPRADEPASPDGSIDAVAALSAPDRPVRTATAIDDEHRDTSEPEGAPSEPLAPSEVAAIESAVILAVEVRNAAGDEIDLETVTVALRHDAHIEPCALARDRARFVSPPIAPARWTVTAEAHGFAPLAVELDLTSRSGALEEALELWPLDWLAVRARTNDGRPFSALAAELGLEIEDVFEAGFRLWQSDVPPRDAGELPAEAPMRPRGELRPTSPHYDSNYEADAVARLWREPGASSWIALAFHERFLGWRHAPAGATEVVFALDLDLVESQFASLDLRIVDRRTLAPIRGARVHLDAEVSGLRRADTDEVEADDEGRVHVAPLIPGEYDLAVTADGASEHRQRLLVPAGTRVDLGDVALDFAPPLEVRVTDARGNPLSAVLQLGPYRRGARVQDCVSPRAWMTNRDGTERIPSPAVPTIVLASRVEVSDGRISLGGSASLVLLDPDRLPPRVEIVVRDPVRVEIDATALGEAAAAAWTEDALGIVIDEDRLESGSTGAGLQPGRYRVRIVDAAGAELGARDFEVVEGGEPIRVAVH